MTSVSPSARATGRSRRAARVISRQAHVVPGATVAGWSHLLGRPRPEARRSQLLARFGVVASACVLVLYLGWRIGFTIPDGGSNRTAAWALIIFEAVPLFGLVIRGITLWNIDCRGPEPVTQARDGQRPAVFIPTYNEPVEVIAPTIAAACELQPAHQTWVLDDGDRPWVAELCAAYGARYVQREVHEHAKAGNMNHALDMMQREIDAGAEPVDIIAVLDCDHVPLPTFLTDTLGWFDDERLALVQGPQSYYNAGAFDDDGETGEQGVFFHVLLPGRNHEGAGPFWCGSTSLIRLTAIQEIGGISTDTIVEDMHTTLGLIRAGWKTAYHHQTLAVGLAPDTADQYLLQRRRWGLGSMQILAKERLWTAKRWLSWRNYYEYLSGTVWWLEGVGTVIAFLIPAAILVTGLQTSTANPLVFTAVFLVMFSIRLWGTKRLFRKHVRWGSAFALRILRIPIGLSCLWWLITRRTLKFQVTPKSGADARLRGRAPTILWALTVVVAATVLYGALGLTGWVPWRTSPPGMAASGVWLALACTVLLLGLQRIRAERYATTRRDAHRVQVTAPVTVAGVDGTLLDVSMGGAAVRVPSGVLADVTAFDLVLPGSGPITTELVRLSHDGETEIASLSIRPGDWAAYRSMALWLFHTPAGAVEGLPPGAPAAAAQPTRHGRVRQSALLRQHA